jgi:hypothetical protein
LALILKATIDEEEGEEVMVRVRVKDRVRVRVRLHTLDLDILIDRWQFCLISPRKLSIYIVPKFIFPFFYLREKERRKRLEKEERRRK